MLRAKPFKKMVDYARCVNPPYNETSSDTLSSSSRQTVKSLFDEAQNLATMPRQTDKSLLLEVAMAQKFIATFHPI